MKWDHGPLFWGLEVYTAGLLHSFGTRVWYQGCSFEFQDLGSSYHHILSGLGAVSWGVHGVQKVWLLHHNIHSELWTIYMGRSMELEVFDGSLSKHSFRARYGIQ